MEDLNLIDVEVPDYQKEINYFDALCLKHRTGQMPLMYVLQHDPYNAESSTLLLHEMDLETKKARSGRSKSIPIPMNSNICGFDTFPTIDSS